MADIEVHRTIKEQIANRIRGEVVNGRLAPGEPLREQALAARFGVSRGPVRDALLQLTHEGLLVAKPNCGVRVGDAPEGPLQELVIELRRKIERTAVELLLNDDPPDLTMPTLALDELREVCEAGRSDLVAERDMAFHRALVEATGEADLLALWLPVTARMMLRYSRLGDLGECFREHRAILAALQARDLAAATAVLEANIR